MKVDDYLVKFLETYKFYTANNPDNVDDVTRFSAAILKIAFEIVLEINNLAKSRNVRGDSAFVGVVRELDNKYTAFLRRLKFDRKPYNLFFRSMILYLGVLDDGPPSEEAFKLFRDLNWEVPDCGNYWALVHKMLNLVKEN